MTIIAGLSDNNLSYNSVKMAQKSCNLFLLRRYLTQGTEPGFGPDSVGCYCTDFSGTTLKPQ